MGFVKSTSTVTDTALTVPNLTGGSNGRIVKLTSANTVANASYQDSVTQLNAILLKSGDIYYSGGLVTGFVGLTPGAPYFLGLNGTLETAAPTPTATNVALYLGFAINTTDFIFRPGIPIAG